MNNLTNILAIATGGALGAVSRYGVMVAFGSLSTFPMGTLSVNVLGAFVLGLLLELNALTFSLPEVWRMGLVVGFLGAFTTFSTFSMDTVYLLQKGQLLKASVYILLSVGLSITVFYLGMKCGKLIVS